MWSRRRSSPWWWHRGKRRRALGAIVALFAAASLAGVWLTSRVPARLGTEGMDGTVQGAARVHDGDTLTIAGRRIRLHGVDAPELDQSCLRDGVAWACGREAAFALAQRVAGRLVSCRGVTTDRFGRLVALCTVDGENLNRWLVREGWAVAYRRYSDAYVVDEWIARWHGRGLWAGSFDPPEEWRQGR